MSWGTLGEPLAEHLDPCVECEDGDCPDCYTAADRAMDDAIDEMAGLIVADARREA